MTSTAECLEVLILPRLGREAMARALAEVVWTVPSLVAVAVVERPPHVVAVRFFDETGYPAEVDLEAAARTLSSGGFAVGLACIAPVADQRRWESWQAGERVEILGVEDETWVPRDEDGFPDFEVEPVRFGEGVPDGWRRLRSCLDLGMERLFSCRFLPVARQFERLRAGEPVDARAFVLVSDGRPMHPPAEIAWQDLYRT